MDGADDLYVARLCRLLPVEDVQALLLTGTFPRHGEWLELAGCMEALNELRLCTQYSGTYHLISPGKLLSLQQVAAGDGQAPCVLLNLRTLTMDKVDFWEDFPGNQERSGDRDRRRAAGLFRAACPGGRTESLGRGVEVSGRHGQDMCELTTRVRADARRRAQIGLLYLYALHSHSLTRRQTEVSITICLPTRLPY